MNLKIEEILIDLLSIRLLTNVDDFNYDNNSNNNTINVKNDYTINLFQHITYYIFKCIVSLS
jgi:hypothetical protein